MMHDEPNPAVTASLQSPLAHEEIAEHLIGLLQSLENQSYGEDVNMLEHSLQTAAAVRDDGDCALTLAALFHDVGHVLDEAGPWGASDHAKAAADHLVPWFAPDIVEPIRLHVEAKRYLVATEPEYHDRLSPASVETLHQQGGVLDPRGVADFAAHPWSDAALRLRRADDAGKVASLDVGGLDQYRPMLQRALAEHSAARNVSAEWARDACRCAECRDPRNGQHLIDSTDLLGWSVVATRHEAVTIRHTDGREHECLIPDDDVSGVGLPSTRWGAEHAKHLRAAVVDASGPLDRFVTDLAEYGIALASGVPTHDGAILDFVRRFGHVRTTNYGELFDVRADPEPINLAYTPTGLPLHTDNPYRDPVPTVQILHCLHGASAGGGSLFADGFAAAERLRDLDRAAFDTLASIPMTFRFASTDVDLRATTPVIDLDVTGAVRRVTVNNRSMEPVGRHLDVDAFYRAYSVFCELLASPEQRAEVQLGAGQLIAFDNRRVLHGRDGFAADPGRHLQGCYADIDAVMSAARLSNS